MMSDKVSEMMIIYWSVRPPIYVLFIDAFENGLECSNSNGLRCCKKPDLSCSRFKVAQSTSVNSQLRAINNSYIRNKHVSDENETMVEEPSIDRETINWSRTQEDRGINDQETDPGTEHWPTKYEQWFNICKIAKSTKYNFAATDGSIIINNQSSMLGTLNYKHRQINCVR